MRIKFLAVIASLLFMSIAISSCLDSDNNTVELSSDVTVHAFGLDTIYGKHYSFTIDQLNRVIYNQDSLPVGSDTIIDRILIDTFSVSGWITAGINDTLFNISDSVDFASVANKPEGMKFKVHAPDGSFREYTVKINKHKLDPDSLVWTEMGTAFSSTPVAQQKAVVLNNELWVYTSNTTASKTIADPTKYQWHPVTSINLPTDVKLSSIICFKADAQNQKLYAVTTSNKVYCSADGVRWDEVVALGSNVKALIPSFTGTLTGIVGTNESYKFNTSQDGMSWQNIGTEEVPATFPLENIYSTNFRAVNNSTQAMVVGTPRATDKSTQTTTWFSMYGSEWTDLSTTTYDAYCPKMNNPVVMYYGNTFYIFGDKLDAIYSSIAGLAWHKTAKKFLLPEKFKTQTAPYTVAIDSQNNIWVVFGGDSKTNTVWRGRLNRLIPTIQ